MGAYENALVEEGSRDDLVREFLAARKEVAQLNTYIKNIERQREALTKILDESDVDIPKSWVETIDRKL